MQASIATTDAGEGVLRFTGNFSLENNGGTAFSYQLEFETQAGQWTEVRLPIDKFIAHSFGRPIPTVKLNAGEVHSVGLLSGDPDECTNTCDPRRGPNDNTMMRCNCAWIVREPDAFA